MILNKLIVHLSDVLIEGYDGEGGIFSTRNSTEPKVDPKANKLHDGVKSILFIDFSVESFELPFSVCISISAGDKNE